MTINLSLSNVDEKIVEALILAARQHGHSIEDEHTAILRRALLGPPSRSFKDVLMSMPNVGRDADFDRHADAE